MQLVGIQKQLIINYLELKRFAGRDLYLLQQGELVNQFLNLRWFEVLIILDFQRIELSLSVNSPNLFLAFFCDLC